MANRRGKRLKGTAVYLTQKTYNAWADSLTAKELSMLMLPATLEDLLAVAPGDRGKYVPISMQMPGWWVAWYKKLPLEDKFRFAEIIEKRLKSHGLIGGVV
jgi:hypothetical protein